MYSSVAAATRTTRYYVESILTRQRRVVKSFVRLRLEGFAEPAQKTAGWSKVWRVHGWRRGAEDLLRSSERGLRGGLSVGRGGAAAPVEVERRATNDVLRLDGLGRVAGG